MKQRHKKIKIEKKHMEYKEICKINRYKACYVNWKSLLNAQNHKKIKKDSGGGMTRCNRDTWRYMAGERHSGEDGGSEGLGGLCA